MAIEIPKDIGERIKRVRKRKGEKLTPLAKAVLTSQPNLSQIENQVNLPSERTLILLAQKLKDDFGIPELRKYIENKGAEEIIVKSRVVAGKPEQSFENTEKIFIPSRMMSRIGETFAVQVQGDSMKNAGIFHGDIVVLHECPEPFNGQAVVARIGEGETSEYTLKTWYKDGSRITLKPANEDFEDIIVKNSTEVSVVGKFAGLIRFGD